MTTHREISDDALNAAVPLLDRYTSADAMDVAFDVVEAALQVDLPGLYVTRHRGDLEVWRDTGDPDRPHAVTDAELRQAVAALLPDRTQEG